MTKRGSGRQAGSEVLIRFRLAEQDPDRAAQRLQAILEKALLHSPEIVGTPEILEAHSLQPPEPLEMDPGNPVSPLWADWRMFMDGRVRGI